MLSQLGFDYLKRHKRQFKMARADVVDVLQRSGVPLFEPVIDFQLRFGGCRIAEDFVFGLFYPDSDGQKPVSPQTEEWDGETRFVCSVRNSVQMWLHINEHGTYFEDRVPHAESVENLIAHYAWVDRTLTRENWTHISQDRLTTKRYEGFLDESQLAVVPEASDAYRQVLRNDRMLYIKVPGWPRLFVKPELARQVGHKKR